MERNTNPYFLFPSDSNFLEQWKFEKNEPGKIQSTTKFGQAKRNYKTYKNVHIKEEGPIYKRLMSKEAFRWDPDNLNIISSEGGTLVAVRA